MDYVSIVGIVLSLVAIVGGQVLEGGHVSSLLQPTAFLIVIGGTFGAILLQSSTKTIIESFSMLKWVFVPPKFNGLELIDQIVGWSVTARRGGLLSLEPYIEDIEDDFTKRGLQMLVDGIEPTILRNALELDISTYDEHLRHTAKVWESAGGYSPTIGILGAVMGLIHVMENLSEPSKLGAGIAVAFVATIYGVGAANLFMIPIAGKLKYLVTQQVTEKQMFVDGLVSIANGENPRLIEEKLKSYLI